MRSYPFVTGVDVAGEILESASSHFSKGDRVIATGYKMGMAEFGGFGEIVHLPEEWVIKSPDNLSNFEAFNIALGSENKSEEIYDLIKGDL